MLILDICIGSSQNENYHFIAMECLNIPLHSPDRGKYLATGLMSVLREVLNTFCYNYYTIFFTQFTSNNNSSLV